MSPRAFVSAVGRLGNMRILPILKGRESYLPALGWAEAILLSFPGSEIVKHPFPAPSKPSVVY